MIVLKPGFSAQPITGTPAKPTVSVRFKDGVADVPEGELTEMMFAHPGFNADFISAELHTVDPYAFTRQPSEPAHAVTELKYGTPVSNEVKGGKVNIPPEIQKMVQNMAIEMAKEMLPGMIKATLESYTASKEGVKVEDNVEAPVEKKKGGRPAKKVETPV